MKKTRLLSMFIAVMMVLLITSSAMAETIVIGGAGPLTGGAAQYGISVEQGAQLYIDQINAELAASGSDTRFELIFEDNGGDLHQLRNHHRSSHGIPHLLPGSLPGRGHGQLCQVQGLHQGSHPVRQR